MPEEIVVFCVGCRAECCSEEPNAEGYCTNCQERHQKDEYAEAYHEMMNDPFVNYVNPPSNEDLPF